MSVPRSFNWNVTSESDPGARDQYRDSFDGLYEIDKLDLGERGVFFNRTRMTLFSAGVIGHGRSNTQILRRSAVQARRAGYDAFSLVLANSEMTGSAGERTFACSPGSILAVDLSRPSQSHWQDLDLVNLVIPRELLPKRLARTDFHGMSLPPGSPAARLIANHMRSLSGMAPELSDEEGRAAVEAALVLVEISLGGSTTPIGDHAAALYRTVRDRASRFIEPRLLDPALSADQIAQACAVSRATLYRAFEEESGLRRYIQRRRLTLARAALARRMSGLPSIADIAHDHGFSSPTHFSRAFRELFGVSPSEIAPADHRNRTTHLEGAIGLGAVVDWLGSDPLDR